MKSQFTRIEQRPSEVRNVTEQLRETVNAFEVASTRQKVLTLARRSAPISTITRYCGCTAQYVTTVINTEYTA